MGVSKEENDTELKSVNLDRKASDAVQLESEFQENVENKDIYSTVVTGAVGAFRFITSLKLELIIFLYMGAYAPRSVTAMSLFMDRSCRVHMKYSDEICDNLDLKIYESQKTLVERMANNFHLGHTLLAAIPSSLLSCFAGPWSDRYSRRIPVIVGMIGFITDDFLSVIWASVPSARVELYYIPTIINGLSGGFVVTVTVLYSYASDITLARNRTLKYALLEAAIGFSMPLGIFAGGIIYKYSGGVAVFSMTLVLHVATFLFVIFFLKETRGIGNTDTWREKLRVFVSTKNLLEGFRATIKWRPHRARLQLWMLFAAMSINMLVSVASASISFVFARHHYNWDNPKYSTVSSVFAIMTTIVMMISVPIFTKLFRLSDPMLGIIGSVSVLGRLVCTSLAATSELFYLGNLLGLMFSISNLAGRARMSKIIPKSDLGKVFAFLTTAEVLIPVLSQAWISQLFNATMGTIPDPTHLLLSATTVIALGIFIWLFFLPKVNYEEIQEEQDRRESIASISGLKVLEKALEAPTTSTMEEIKVAEVPL